MIDEYFDSEGVKVYLKLLINSIKSKKKIVLVLDNAAPHKSKIITDFIKEHTNRIELLYLPPYSPDLQPAELIWREIRKERIHNKYFPCKQEMLETIEDFLKVYSRKNVRFQNLCRFKYVV
jgi:transposase